MKDALIRRIVLLQESGLTFECRVMDVKFVYGNRRYLVKPCRGTGKAWVNSDRVTVKEEAK